jgi:Ca2+:H+ antiporter
VRVTERTNALRPAKPWIAHTIREEWFLGVSVITVAIFWIFGESLFAGMSNPFWLAVIFVYLFGVVLGTCLCVVRHADHIAKVVGEPYGTLVLTLSVTTIEVVSISAVMLHGENNPTLVRDTLFSVVMIILGGMAGVSLLLGGWRYREQQYNLQGANAYLGLIIPLTVFSLTLPNFTVTTPGPTLSVAQQIFLTLMSLGLYASFLAVQTGRHRGYFTMAEVSVVEPKNERTSNPRPWVQHGILLLAYILPIAFLAEELARPIDYLIETMREPEALGGVIIAMIVATPEAVGATRAALQNQIQHSVNIFLGSVLSTIGLTVPIMLIISRFTGRIVHLGLSGANDVLLLVTLTVCVITFTSGRTNILQGAVHFVLFGAFLLFIFEA